MLGPHISEHENVKPRWSLTRSPIVERLSLLHQPMAVLDITKGITLSSFFNDFIEQLSSHNTKHYTT